MRLLLWIILVQSSVCLGLDATLKSGLKSKVNEATIRITGIAFSREQFRGLFMSGLTSRLEFVIAVRAKDRGAFNIREEWKIYYDLWDEIFRVNIKSQEKVNAKIEFRTIDMLFRSIENPEFESINLQFPLQDFADGSGVLAIRMSLNPISQETVERVKKWVNQRQVPGLNIASLSPQEAASKGKQGLTPQLSGLFNQILVYEANNASQSAAWHFEGVSKITLMESKK